MLKSQTIAYLLPIALLLIVVAASPSDSATFQVEAFDLRPIREPTIHVTMSGPIVSGDAEKLTEVLAKHSFEGMRDILFLMDSPGGSLIEGLAIGRVIASLPEITSAQVGSIERPDATCASACVLSYLGADYRYLAERGRIGVHRFAAPDTDMSGAEALSVAQEMSAVLTEYMRQQRADPAFYERMARTPFDGIDWVDRKQLEEWRVVTGPVYDEWTEYRNANGSIALFLGHISLYGENSMTLLCGDRGLVGLASLNKPELSMYGRMELAIDGDGFTVPDYQVVKDSERFAQVAFQIPADSLHRIAAAKSFGVRILLPSEYGFFGFEMQIKDNRLREMVTTCSTASVANPSATGMRLIQGTDYPGGDVTSSGIRGISLDACLRACDVDNSCRAVSYVTELSWCWPKSQVGQPTAAPGIVSAIK